MELLPPLPQSIDIEPTTKCNYRCTMCQRTYWKKASKDMTFDSFQKIVDSIPTLKEIKLQGIGEPFLNSEIFRMIEYAKQLDLNVTIYTNASLFGDEELLQRLLDSHIDLLRISLDAGSKEIYEQIRKGGRFEAVIENIGRITSNNRTISCIELWTLLMNSNYLELPHIIDIACHSGIKTINLQLILNTFAYKKEIKNIIKCQQFTLTEALISNIKKNLEYASNNSVELKLAFSKAYSPQNKCHWSFDKAFISVEGYIVPCCTIADPEVISFGNALTDPFERIWYGEKYISFRQRILENELIEPCMHCYSEAHKQVISRLTMHRVN